MFRTDGGAGYESSSDAQVHPPTAKSTRQIRSGEVQENGRRGARLSSSFWEQFTGLLQRQVTLNSNVKGRARTDFRYPISECIPAATIGAPSSMLSLPSIHRWEAGYRLESDDGSPNHGSTPFSKRVMAQIQSPVRVRTYK